MKSKFKIHLQDRNWVTANTTLCLLFRLNKQFLVRLKLTCTIKWISALSSFNRRSLDMTELQKHLQTVWLQEKEQTNFNWQLSPLKISFIKLKCNKLQSNWPACRERQQGCESARKSSMYKKHQQFIQVYRLTHVRFHSYINSAITCIIVKSSVGFG